MNDNLITDDMVSAALDYLALDPHPCALAKAEMVHAENLRKKKYSALFLKAEGKTVAEREAWAETNAEYDFAQSHEVEKIREFEAQKARTVSAQTITEMWRSVQANNRAAERVR